MPPEMTERRERARLWHIERERQQAELEALPESDLKQRAIDALDSASNLLWTNAPVLDVQLRSNGWTQDFARELGDHLADIRVSVEDGTYDGSGSGLGRWMIEQVSPKTTDFLKQAVYHASYILKALEHKREC
jgi:hypothetical protein